MIIKVKGKSMVSISSLFKGTQVVSKELPKTGTKISNWTKGSNSFKKVVYGEGNQVAKNTGLKEYTVKTDKNGKRTFSATYTNQNGDSIQVNDPYYMKMARNNNGNQNYTMFKLLQMFEGMISGGKI